MSTQNNQVDPNTKKEENSDQQSEPITTPEEVPESNDEKIDQDFPGYPHYPAQDDILNPGNGTQRVDVDIENFTPSDVNQDLNLNKNITEGTTEIRNASVVEDGKDADDDLQIVPGTEADVTEDDLMILEQTDRDLKEGSEIRQEDVLTDLTGDELDVPGAELDDANESLGEEDEENNYYSIGGDNHDTLEGR